jgi:hypothetical protein
MDEMDEIERPVAMPRAIRVIATLLMALPGSFMWLGGLFATTIGTATLFTARPTERLASLALFGASLAALVVGYTMVATASWLNGSHHYRMPGRRLPAYVVMEILEQFLAAVSVGFLVVSAVSLASGSPPYPLLWIFSAAVGFALLGLNMRLRRKLGGAWREELLAGPEGAKPPY